MSYGRWAVRVLNNLCGIGPWILKSYQRKKPSNNNNVLPLLSIFTLTPIDTASILLLGIYTKLQTYILGKQNTWLSPLFSNMYFITAKTPKVSINYFIILLC